MKLIWEKDKIGISIARPVEYDIYKQGDYWIARFYSEKICGYISQRGVVELSFDDVGDRGKLPLFCRFGSRKEAEDICQAHWDNIFKNMNI